MMRDVAIIGCGMTKFGRLEGKDLMDLLAEASLRAIDDAGTGKRDFDSVYVGNMMAGELVHQTAVATPRPGLRPRDDRKSTFSPGRAESPICCGRGHSVK